MFAKWQPHQVYFILIIFGAMVSLCLPKAGPKVTICLECDPRSQKCSIPLP